VAPVDADAATSAGGPSISFTGGVLAPVACSSTPDPPGLNLAKSTRVVLVNFTGADATLDLGTGTPIAVGDGAAVSVKFKKGEYRVRMVPDCPGTLQIQAAIVSVGKTMDARPHALPGPPNSAGPAADPSPPATAGGSGPAPAASPSAAPGGRVGDAETIAGGSAMVEPGQEVLVVAPMGDRPDARGARLLAVIATICVFGVTTAIIRAIVAQRTTRSARTSQHE
jgi:hypothetical protein